MEISFAVIICAAGSSNRMGGIKKEYLPFPNREMTVLGAAVSAFVSCQQTGPVVITIPPGGENTALMSLPQELVKRVHFVTGGPTRRASVYNALVFLESFTVSHVLIHDGARPWIKQDLIMRIMEAVTQYSAVIPALPLVETPKELGSRELCSRELEESSGAPLITGFIKKHLRRAEICTAQTPQAFRFPEILRAHEKAKEREGHESSSSGNSFDYTDDAEIWGEFIGQVAVIPGDPENRKITYPEDLNV